MTDKYNTKEFEDSQSTNILANTQPGENGEKKKKKKGDFSFTALYEEGIKILGTCGITAKLQQGAPFCNHNLYIDKVPSPIRGLKYPTHFRPLQPIRDITGLKRIEAAFSLTDPDIQEFWEPLYRPNKDNSDLLRLTDRMIWLKSLQEQEELHKPLEYLHTFDPDGKLKISNRVSRSPMSWVPERSWFDAEVQKLKFSDIFTLFPEAETELLKLIIGRIGVGRSNHFPENGNTPISHTSRMAAVIVGQDAGLGKSTLFNIFTSALSKVGMTTGTFRSVRERFGLKAGALSDVMYKDDTADDTLREFLRSEETKIMISGGLLTTEEKFERSEAIWPKCVIILNSNKWDATLSYSLDPGIQSRIKILSTKRAVEIVGPDYDYRPHYHLRELADSINVDIECLMLWCLRLGTDAFWNLIAPENNLSSENKLELEVKRLTSKLRYRFKSDAIISLINAMALSTAIVEGSWELLPEFNMRLFYRLCKNFYFVATDPSCLELMNAIKRDWKEEGETVSHPYQGFRDISLETIKSAMVWFEQNVLCRAETAVMSHSNGADIVKKFMEHIYLRDGYKLAQGIAYLVEAWNSSRYHYLSFSPKAESFRKSLDEWSASRLKEFQDGKISESDDTWMDNHLYSPDNAESLRFQKLLELKKVS